LQQRHACGHGTPPQDLLTQRHVAVIGGDPAVLGHACQYMYARCIGNPFVLLNFVLIGCCRGLKDAKTPLYAVLLSNVSNLIMDILFVYGFNMGAGGAALATSFSQMLSCSILFSILRRRCALALPGTLCMLTMNTSQLSYVAV
jgi:multidrug resistance protein, MATE family